MHGRAPLTLPVSHAPCMQRKTQVCPLCSTWHLVKVVDWLPFPDRDFRGLKWITNSLWEMVSWGSFQFFKSIRLKPLCVLFERQPCIIFYLGISYIISNFPFYWSKILMMIRCSSSLLQCSKNTVFHCSILGSGLVYFEVLKEGLEIAEKVPKLLISFSCQNHNCCESTNTNVCWLSPNFATLLTKLS